MQKASYDFKHAIVKGIVESMQEYPDTTDDLLMILSKSLDACEHINLSTEVLHIVADMGPFVRDASKHVPYIYNCFLLGSRPIRAAAVSALGKFAAHHQPLRRSLIILLKRCLRDDDDETRDRAANAVAVLTNTAETPLEENEAEVTVQPSDDDLAAQIYSPLATSFSNLERSLHAYKSMPGAMENSTPLLLESLPIVEDETPEPIEQVSQSAHLVLPSRRKSTDPADDVYAIPELASFGKIALSSVPVPLSERETEYVVHCIKHVSSDHIVLQFKVENTVEQQRLDNVSVSVVLCEGDEELYENVGELSAASIPWDSTQSCFVVLKRNMDARLSPCTLTCELQFTVCSIDEESGEEIGESYEEEYTLEDLEVLPSDFMAKLSIGDFRSSWETLSSKKEVSKKVGLQFSTMQEAVCSVVKFLGMDTCDNTSHVKKNGKAQMLHLSGTVLGDEPVLARAQLSPHNELFVLKIVVRSEDPEISQTVLDWIR